MRCELWICSATVGVEAGTPVDDVAGVQEVQAARDVQRDGLALAAPLEKPHLVIDQRLLQIAALQCNQPTLLRPEASLSMLCIWILLSK